MTNRKAQARQAFDAQVEAWGVEAFEAGASSFPEFLARLPGVYPAVALDALYRLQRSGRVSVDLSSSLERQPRSDGHVAPIVLSPLPPPHPLDFEWRFTKRAANELLSVAQTLAKPDDRVVLLGTPAVAAVATVAPIDRATVFIGEDNPITGAVVVMNILNGRPLLVQACNPQTLLPKEAGVVIVDPPWYFDFLRPMLAAAASSCRAGGFVLLSLLPIGTRPGAAQERARIIRYLQGLSLEIAEMKERALAYETPFFEANALAAAGLNSIPGDWRRSDLLVLRKKRSLDRPLVFRAPQKHWHETMVGRMRLFVSRSERKMPLSGPVIQSLLPGDILPSVSRRDSRRRKAQVWTSGNRIFASQRPDIVLAAAMRAGNGKGASLATHGHLSNTERDELNRLSYALLTLAEKEEAEEYPSPVLEAPCLSEDSTSNSIASSLTSRTTVFG
jgi:hypothetical protein